MSDLEVAAVVAALAVLAAETEEAAATPTGEWSAWADPARAVRRPLRPGPGAWRRSTWGRSA